MALKDRFRRAVTRSSTTTRSNSVVSTSSTSNQASSPLSPTTTTSPSTLPAITLTKTSSRLSKTLTFRSDKRAKNKEEKRQAAWEEADRKGPGNGKAAQELLRGFEWKDAWRRSLSLDRRGSGWGRKGSAVSGVSPGGSRVGSVDEGVGRRSGQGQLRRVSVMSDGGGSEGRLGEVETVVEE